MNWLRRKIRKTRRRTVSVSILAIFGLSFFFGWFVGVNPETGSLEFTLGGENSLSGSTLNFTASAIGLPQIIGDDPLPDELAFSEEVNEADEGDSEQSSTEDATQAGTTAQGSVATDSVTSPSSTSDLVEEGDDEVVPGTTATTTRTSTCLLYTSPSPRDRQKSRMPSSA